MMNPRGPQATAPTEPEPTPPTKNLEEPQPTTEEVNARPPLEDRIGATTIVKDDDELCWINESDGSVTGDKLVSCCPVTNKCTFHSQFPGHRRSPNRGRDNLAV